MNLIPVMVNYLVILFMSTVNIYLHPERNTEGKLKSSKYHGTIPRVGMGFMDFSVIQLILCLQFLDTVNALRIL